jgi:hypothetical protein
MVNMTDEPGLTGAEKVSILLLALGEDVAPLVLKKMTEQEIQRITVPDSKERNRILNFSSLLLRCMHGVRIFNAYPVERVLHGSVAWSAVCTST